MYSVQCTVNSVQYTVYSKQCTVYSVQCTVNSIQCTVYSKQCTVYSKQCRVYIWYLALKLRIYRLLKSAICLKWILKKFSTTLRPRSNTLHIRSLPLILIFCYSADEQSSKYTVTSLCFQFWRMIFEKQLI